MGGLIFVILYRRSRWVISFRPSSIFQVVGSISADGIISIDPSQLGLAMSSDGGLQMQLAPNPTTTIVHAAEQPPVPVVHHPIAAFQDTKQQPQQLIHLQQFGIPANTEAAAEAADTLAAAAAAANPQVMYTCTNCSSIFRTIEAVEDHINSQLCGQVNDAILTQGGEAEK